MRVCEAEREIAGRFGRKYALLTGRGATALMLLYETLSPKGGRVILPAIGCPSILATVLLTGRRAAIVDVGCNLNIDPEKLMGVVREGDIVVGIHLFGIPFAVEAVSEICKRSGAVLIEDAAQAIGGSYKGKLLGSFGKASILSFGKGKILPTEGGGAILTDDDGLAEKLKDAVKKLPERPVDLSERAREFRDKVTPAFNRARRGEREAASLWGKLYLEFGEIYRYSIIESEAEAIVRALKELEDNGENRRRRALMYRSYLSDLPCQFLPYSINTVPWRYTIIMWKMDGNEVQDCTEALRAEGIDVSNLYLPLHWLAPELVEATECRRAEFVSPRIMNFWVDNTVDEGRIAVTKQVIHRFCSEKR